LRHFVEKPDFYYNFCYKILRVFLKGEEKSKTPLKFSFGNKGGVAPKLAWEANTSKGTLE